MKNFQELQDYVKKKGFGTTLYGNINGQPVYLSRGIRELFLGNEGDIQKIIDAVTAFEHEDYGNAAEHGKNPSAGHEYGRYEIATLPSDQPEDDTAVWIHKDGKAVIVYFAFER